VNAILIVPQGPKNAPDSFGGKLEEKDGFEQFIEEIVIQLNDREVINTQEIGTIILSGHSGAYRVIGYILDRGGLTKHIKEVYLFDALYGELEKYLFWLDNYPGKFINIYTKDGGTKEESEKMMEDISSRDLRYCFINEKRIKNDGLSRNRLIFIYSTLGHNEVIHKRQQFYRFLLNSKLDHIKE